MEILGIPIFGLEQFKKNGGRKKAQKTQNEVVIF
jgi:hypothetical protein